MNTYENAFIATSIVAALGYDLPKMELMWSTFSGFPGNLYNFEVIADKKYALRGLKKETSNGCVPCVQCEGNEIIIIALFLASLITFSVKHNHNFTVFGWIRILNKTLEKLIEPFTIHPTFVLTMECCFW